MRRVIILAIILNIFFIVLFVICLILSIYLPLFFFIPLMCFLPFVFRRRGGFRESFVDLNKYPKEVLKEKDFGLKLRYCPVCNGEIKEPVAKFCYHCGSKLNKD